MLPDEVEAECQRILEGLGWDEKHFQISAFQKLGTDALCHDVMNMLDTLPVEELNSEEETDFKWDNYHEQVMSEYEDDDDDDDFDDDDYDVEVIYER